MKKIKNIKNRKQKKATLAIDRLVEDYATLRRIVLNCDSSSELMKEKIKKFMGKNEILIGLDGSPLCTYIESRPFVVTDWKAVANEYNPPSELITKHSKTITTRPLSQLIR